MTDNWNCYEFTIFSKLNVPNKIEPVNFLYILYTQNLKLLHAIRITNNLADKFCCLAKEHVRYRRTETHLIACNSAA